MSEVTTYGRAFDTSSGVIVKTSRPDVPNLSDEVTVIWKDNRCITSDQMRKAWALMGEIAAYQGETSKDVYREQSSAFTIKHLQTLQDGLFHLSTATVSTARAFINMLIEIIVEYGIPTKEPLTALCDDIEKYVYACLLNRKCAVCGAKTELHHVDQVGMGRNRREIDHLGMQCLPLCRKHHDEAHTIGKSAFMARYHLESVAVDERIAKVYHLHTGGNDND